ncbi:MAG: hypothetical protein EA409_10275 [Saprospirales bacterium]|nr:MAG: hypothetical protein EA409_10275 [Saprospirales bacterium]
MSSILRKILHKLPHFLIIASVGEKYILMDKYHTLQEIARKVSEILPSAIQPKLMPDFIAHTIHLLVIPSQDYQKNRL